MLAGVEEVLNKKMVTLGHELRTQDAKTAFFLLKMSNIEVVRNFIMHSQLTDNLALLERSIL